MSGKKKKGAQPSADNSRCPEGKRHVRSDANSLLSPRPLVFFSTVFFEKQIVCEGYLKISKLIKIIYGMEAEIAGKTNRPEMKYG